MRVFKLTGNNYAAVYDLPDHRYFAEIYGDDWRIIGFWRTSIKTPLTENELQRRLAERQAVEGKAVSIRAAVALTAAPASTIYKLLSSGSLKSENGKITIEEINRYIEYRKSHAGKRRGKGLNLNRKRTKREIDNA